jgi:hypothetical protein
MKAVEDLITKLKSLDTTLNSTLAIKEDLENKLLIDGLLDETRDSLNRELESVNLKIRWVNDEKKTIIADLDEALRILEDKSRFIAIQKEDIQLLLEQIA